MEKVAELVRHKYKEPKGDFIKKMKDPIGSVKHDGGNYFLVFDEKGVSSLISRKRSVTGDVINKAAQVPHISSKVIPELAGHVFNLELYHSGFSKSGTERHNVLSGILNSLPPKAIDTQERVGPVRAAVFDVIYPKLDTYRDKLAHIQTLENLFGNSDYLHKVETHEGHKAIEKLIESTQKKGQEGVVVVDGSVDESYNPRGKIKHYNTYNLRVAGHTQGYDIYGNPKQCAGALVVVDGSGKEVANVGIGLSQEQREDIYNNPAAWHGKLIQVKAMRTTARRLRHPQYNGDADGEIDFV